MGPKPLTIRARIAVMAALGLALFALGPMADAQTTSSIPTAENAKSAKGKEADTKSKDKKSKDSNYKDTKSKDAKSKDAKSKNAKGAKSDPKASKTASKSSETAPTVPYNGPASAADVAHVKTAVGLARQGKTSQATDEQREISDPAAR
jgi:hypothetical protein